MSQSKSLPKVSTGVKGLDKVLQDGFPEGRMTIVSGGTGCGKSILSLQFLYHSVLQGVPGIFITFEERAKAIRENAHTLGWDLEALEKEGRFFLMDARLDPSIVMAGDFDLYGLLAIIDGKVAEIQAGRVVLDAVDVLLRSFHDLDREREELYALHHWLSEHKMTTLLTVKTVGGQSVPLPYEYLDFLADCVVHLEQQTIGQITTRRLRVVKYRGSGFRSNEYPFVITEKGLNVPFSPLNFRHHPLGERISSGNAELDDMLDGGYRRGANILMMGVTGVGKTSLAVTFVKSACAREEKALYIGFEESREAIIGSMRSAGIDLSETVKSNRLQFLTALPEAMGAEAHLVYAIEHIETFHPDLIVVDTISSCNRMGSERDAMAYLTQLLNACKERQITSMFISQTQKLMDINEASKTTMASIADTIIYMGIAEKGGVFDRLITVLKSRGSNHANTYRRFAITDQGIQLESA